MLRGYIICFNRAQQKHLFHAMGVKKGVSGPRAIKVNKNFALITRFALITFFAPNARTTQKTVNHEQLKHLFLFYTKFPPPRFTIIVQITR